MIKFVKLLSFVLIFFTVSFVYSKDIEFTSVPETKSGANENDFGLFVKFNNASLGYNYANGTAQPNTTARLTMFGVAYKHDGKDVGFNVFTSGGYTSETRENNAVVDGGTSYMIDAGADLNYIIMNNNIFWSAGIAGTGFIGGMFVDRTTLKQGTVGVINTLGIDTRVAFYPLEEIYFTGFLSFGFLPLYAESMTGKTTTANTTYSFTVNRADSPFQFSVNGKVYYRPSPNFAISTGIGFSSTSYTDSVSKDKYAFSNFYPYVGMDFMF